MYSKDRQKHPLPVSFIEMATSLPLPLPLLLPLPPQPQPPLWNIGQQGSTGMQGETGLTGLQEPHGVTGLRGPSGNTLPLQLPAQLPPPMTHETKTTLPLQIDHLIHFTPVIMSFFSEQLFDKYLLLLWERWCLSSIKSSSHAHLCIMGSEYVTVGANHENIKFRFTLWCQALENMRACFTRHNSLLSNTDAMLCTITTSSVDDLQQIQIRRRRFHLLEALDAQFASVNYLL